MKGWLLIETLAVLLVANAIIWFVVAGDWPRWGRVKMRIACAALLLVGVLTLVSLSAACTTQTDSCGGLGTVPCFEKCQDDLYRQACGSVTEENRFEMRYLQCKTEHAQSIGETCTARCLYCSYPE